MTLLLTLSSSIYEEHFFSLNKFFSLFQGWGTDITGQLHNTLQGGVGFFEYVTLSVTGVGTHTTTAHIVTIIHWDREEGGGRGEH